MRLIKIKVVMDMTGLGRSTIYKFMAEGSFPMPVRLSTRSVAWVESEIQNWIQEKIDQRDAG